jgi:hypothetical protein
LALASAALLPWGCGTFPLPRVYVLGDPGASAPGIKDEAGLPHIELKTVTVPDCLDTTDPPLKLGRTTILCPVKLLIAKMIPFSVAVKVGL